jgi:nitroimidazol reductase NimA-like FMN-containing flavoprotein (pyridoxamine 5'-phosphate oxidase superfamily)
MRAMRKKESEMPSEGALSILKSAEYGVLSTLGKDGSPYGVPMNYVFEGDEIFLHGAKEGYRTDNLVGNGNVCFTVVGSATFVPERLTTAYESVIVFGKATIASSESEKREIMSKFVKKFAPDQYEDVMKGVDKALPVVSAIRIKISGMSGKFRK